LDRVRAYQATEAYQKALRKRRCWAEPPFGEAKRGFVLLPKRWVVERSFAWAARFRRLARDYERLPATLAGLHFLAFACLFLHRGVPLLDRLPFLGGS
jgi:transposase